MTMPIFSNRSIARMLADIAPVLGAMRERDLRGRLTLSADEAIATEWEIAALYCLAQQGKVKAVRSRPGVAEPEVIYTSMASRARVAVEVTAVSDAPFHDRNPVEAFDEELRRVATRLGIDRYGGIQSGIGYAKDRGGMRMGVPRRKDIAAFFRSPEFSNFIRAIRSSPDKQIRYEFAVDGISSCLEFRPGGRTIGGGHIVHYLIFDPLRNLIASRLKTKTDQISKSKLEVPAVVILCDADCYTMRSGMRTPGTYNVGQVIDLFLHGRAHIEMKPWLIQRGSAAKSRRINAVAVWSVRQHHSASHAGRAPIEVRSELVLNSGDVHHALDPSVALEIAGAIRYLPPLRATPARARHLFGWRERSRPGHYGASSVSIDRKGKRMRIKISVLTLQGMLAGKISPAQFARDHDIVAQQLDRAEREGLMISDLKIERCLDEDDDWAVLEFNAISPNHLFDPVIREPRRGESLKDRLQRWFGNLFAYRKSLSDSSLQIGDRVC